MAETTVYVIEEIDLSEVEILGTLRLSPNHDKFSPKSFYAYSVEFNDGETAVLAPHQYADLVYIRLNGGYCVET